MEKAIKALENYYRENGRGRSLEYTYGFMDALAVLRELDTERQNQRNTCDTLRP